MFFLSVLVTCVFTNLNSLFAQTISLKLKNCSVQEAVSVLIQKEGYSISFATEEVDLNRKISVDATDASLEDVLNQIFIGQNLSFDISGKRISVNKMKPEPETVENLQGIVTDSNGEPLIGASVIIQGGAGTITDLDGKI